MCYNINMNEEEMKKIIDKIIELEKTMETSSQEVINEMTNKFIDIATKLSFEDMLQIDEYITKNNLLTK